MPAGEVANAEDWETRIETEPLVADSTTWGATESGALITGVASLVNGQRYAVTLITKVSVDVANDEALVRIREDNATGTQIDGVLVRPTSTAASGFPVMLYAEYTATATGSKTFVVTGQRNAGTGTAHRIRAGTARPTYLRIDRIVE